MPANNNSKKEIMKIQLKSHPPLKMTKINQMKITTMVLMMIMNIIILISHKILMLSKERVYKKM